MPYHIEKSLYTSANPLVGEGPYPIVAEDAPDANFVLAGAGALIPDEDAQRLGIVGRDGVTQKSQSDWLAGQDATNRATHGSGAAISAGAASPEPGATPDLANSGLARPAAESLIEAPRPQKPLR